MSKKRSYNPFKMWGSYVGALIGGIIGFLSFNVIIGLEDYSVPMAIGILNLTYGVPIGIISGFLLGWAIHSLIRKLR